MSHLLEDLDAAVSFDCVSFPTPRPVPPLRFLDSARKPVHSTTCKIQFKWSGNRVLTGNKKSLFLPSLTAPALVRSVDDGNNYFLGRYRTGHD